MAKPSDRQVLYPSEYVWLVFLSAMDVMLTWIILYRGGYEVNSLAAKVIHHFGLKGLVVFKFALVVLVILICEYVGRRSPKTGKSLATIGILITCLPLALAFLLLVI